MNPRQSRSARHGAAYGFGGSDILSSAHVRSYEEREQGFENFERRRWAAGNGDVNGQDRRYRSDAGVASAEEATSARTIADGDNPLGFGSRPVGSLESLAHVVGDGAGDEQDVRVTRRGYEPQTKTLDIVEGIAERMDLELATVARAGIDLANGKAATERASARAFEALARLPPGPCRQAAEPFRSVDRGSGLESRVLRMGQLPYRSCPA